MPTSSEKINLIGTLRNEERVDLVVFDGLQRRVVAPVNKPYSAPGDRTPVRCILCGDEVQASTFQFLQSRKESGEPTEFEYAGIVFKGIVEHLSRGTGAGAASANGAIIPQEEVFIRIEPVS